MAVRQKVRQSGCWVGAGELRAKQEEGFRVARSYWPLTFSATHRARPPTHRT